jgi:hypothetical protein
MEGKGGETMQDPINPQRPPENDGKSTAFALAGMVGIALLAVLAIALTRSDNVGDADQFALNDTASNSRIEQCNQYAAQVARESGGTGGTDTVRDDDPNLVGVSDENRYSDAARVAYRDCMLGIQHDS